MLNKVSFRFAINSMLVILCLVIVFHLLVLTQMIPYTIVWGGKFQNVAEMRNFEALSIIINAFMIAVIAVKGHFIKFYIPIKIINIILWLFIMLFVLNTIGNLFATTFTETIVFTPVSFISAILCYRIVMNGKKLRNNQG